MSGAPCAAGCSSGAVRPVMPRDSVLRAAVIAVLIALILLCSSPSQGSETRPKVLLPSAKADWKAAGNTGDTFGNYVTALEKAGCEPVIVSADDEVDIDGIDGVLLPGGADINSAFLNQKPFENPTWTDPAFDRFELEIIKKAWEKDMPILTVCRGAQILNVSRGGTLYGDLPSEKGITGGVWHRDPRTKKETHHIITVAEGSLLYAILMRPVKIVNSHHHHAVREFGEGLVADAEAPDGVIESFHAPDRTFCLGVQFHPERLINEDALFLNIFRRFREEAAKYRKARESSKHSSFLKSKKWGDGEGY